MVLNKLTLFTLIFSIQFAYSQKVNWVSFEQALELQKTNPKNIMMDVYTEWCGPCKMMDKNTFENPLIAKFLNDNFYSVKFNAEGTEEINFYNKTFTNPNHDPNRRGRNSTHQFTQFLGVKGYPTMVFFSEDGDPIMPLVGYYKPKQIELYLKMIKQGDYQIFSKPEDFQNYKKNFVPRFRG